MTAMEDDRIGCIGCIGCLRFIWLLSSDVAMIIVILICLL